MGPCTHSSRIFLKNYTLVRILIQLQALKKHLENNIDWKPIKVSLKWSLRTNQPEARWSSSLFTSAANWISYTLTLTTAYNPLYIVIEFPYIWLLLMSSIYTIPNEWMFFSRKWHRHRHDTQPHSPGIQDHSKTWAAR